MLTVKKIAKIIDHTILKPNATSLEITKACNECKKYGFGMIAINSAQVKFCKEQLKETGIHVGAAISFPLGQTTLETKLFETKNSIDNGCDEIDYVINIGELKNGNIKYVGKEMEAIVGLCHDRNIISKAILENCYLERNEIIELCKIALKIKPDFIKTSTGFGISGAKVEDVKLMKSIVKDEVGIKAAGGIRDLNTFLEMIDAGATRIGTTSSIKIIKEYQNSKGIQK
ncbi:MAG: deoxyribose-phosphate aldolase [Tissierellaceae bacterium]|nr:deoxyribose-phosphate aldolase [Tissierellaceae bacterium]